MAADSDADLLALLPDPEPVFSWVHGGEGLVGWGEAARIEVKGADRFAEAERWWADLVAAADVEDAVGLPGTGLVAFVSMSFADEPGSSVVIVPKVVVGRRDGVTWRTELRDDDEPFAPAVQPVRRVRVTRYSEGRLSVTDYRKAVAGAVERMRAGELAKVVLAHDLIAETDSPLDQRFLLRNLADRYPSCWVFAVDGLIGATPEMLLRKTGETVESRVLAGTAWPGAGESAESRLSSAKNRSEHEFAIRSLADTLRPYCTELHVPETPSVLRLPNVAHLASDVTGRLDPDTTAGPGALLRLGHAVHPTAAVGGTPRTEAVALIAELEAMDRGRYAGPVGWIDADGDGELGIALRCAELRGSLVRLFAGCGIVSGSDPDAEVREAAAKMLPIRDALEAT
ncbi:menaquinone-specific isochorismate synthase [Actinoalloteichus hoggarensis]|uniref:isochorismate synthase n=1 Tax=Actinoalloteichus hoggarensis TaxID=1470176 RepID=UPI0017DA974A|nr:isochorismate synthase [Actinoalloteichus hoggarensis]MBB5921509.1 menaquinone-specific isochorismate synthase [Actinoalloteichus hoggarensis]